MPMVNTYRTTIRPNGHPEGEMTVSSRMVIMQNIKSKITH